MIKKSLFEDELINGMQRELHSHEKKQGMNNLVKAADYLNAAVEIFEEAGMTAKADQVLRLLGKIAIAAAHDSKVRQMPSLQKLMEAGVTHKDLRNTNDPVSRARVNTAMRVLGYTDREIQGFLGEKFMSEEDAADMLNPEKPYGKIMEWIDKPTTPVDPNNLQPGEEISFESMPDSRPKMAPQGPGLGEISMKSILASDEQQAKVKSKSPAKVNDSHTNGLTSEKMVANLENHGTVFNMTDDSAADDLLDLDFNEAANELLEGNAEDKTFEDSD